MKTIGFLISDKENEKRRALTLSDIKKINNKKQLYFETGYGDVLGITDKELIEQNCIILKRRKLLRLL